jgi:hypothetical protein
MRLVGDQENSIWNTVPELVEYAKRHPPPKMPKRKWVRKPQVRDGYFVSSYYQPTKAFTKYLQDERDWEIAGLQHLEASLKKKYNQEK